MKKTFTLFLASAALTAAIGLPAWSLARASLDGSPAFAAVPGDVQSSPITLASGDDDQGDDDERENRRATNSRHGGDDEGDDCDEEGDSDEAACAGESQRNAVPAGRVAPPANGLFGNGAPPVAVTN